MFETRRDKTLFVMAAGGVRYGDIITVIGAVKVLGPWSMSVKGANAVNPRGPSTRNQGRTRDQERTENEVPRPKD